MTKRQKIVLTKMEEAMATQFEINDWRERMQFPSGDELFCRAYRAIAEARNHALIGSTRDALSHAADAANLVGLAVLYWQFPPAPTAHTGDST